MPSINALREEAMRTGLSLRDAPADPMRLFQAWFEQAKAAGASQPRAMAMATVNALGRPSARMLVLAGCDEGGFDFTTDDHSPKALHLARQPWAALVFYWAEMERQVRIEGRVEPLDDAHSDAYFQKRARESQIAAWAARQSEVIADRAVLEERLLQLLADHEHKPVTRPPYYSAHRLRPAMLEFWQARTDHLNDRVRYTLSEDGTWTIELLEP